MSQHTGGRRGRGAHGGNDPFRAGQCDGDCSTSEFNLGDFLEYWSRWMVRMAEQLNAALRLMQEALELLDTAGADTVSPHLDLAVQRLTDLIDELPARCAR